jgi:hypothetical protein
MEFRKRIAIATLIFSAVIAEPARSQGTPEQRRACTPDVFRLCSSFIPDADRITACLVSHRRDLSEACAGVMSFAPRSSVGWATAPEPTLYAR